MNIFYAQMSNTDHVQLFLIPYALPIKTIESVKIISNRIKLTRIRILLLKWAEPTNDEHSLKLQCMTKEKRQISNNKK